MENNQQIHYGKRFVKEGYPSLSLSGQEFENCRFEGCDFSHTDLSGVLFSGCEFTGCRFVLPRLRSSYMQKVIFRECLLSGADFGQCAKLGFSAAFLACRVDNCSFREIKMPKTPFTGSELAGCFFSGSNLSGATFDDCRLPDTDFDRCNLTGADFRTAADFSIDPGRNTIKKAKFASYNLSGLLRSYGIIIE